MDEICAFNPRPLAESDKLWTMHAAALWADTLLAHHRKHQPGCLASGSSRLLCFGTGLLVHLPQIDSSSAQQGRALLSGDKYGVCAGGRQKSNRDTIGRDQRRQPRAWSAGRKISHSAAFREGAGLL